MEANKFELTARVNFVEIKYKESGTVFTRALLSKKGKEEGTYDTFPITLFGKSAEGFAEAIKKGDTVNVTGRISISKYNKDGKDIERVDLVAFEFTKVKYDESAKKYVAISDDTTKAVAKKEEEKPW
jgi:single-stranded DNA-binding protein